MMAAFMQSDFRRSSLKTFKKLGGEITAQEAVAPDQTDMSGVLTSIAAGAPELIYHPIFIQAGTQLILQAKPDPRIGECLPDGRRRHVLA